MPQVNFYILHHTQINNDRDRFACQLTDKVWHQGYQVYIHTISIVQAKRLDDFLWTFQTERFLPHDLYPDEPASIAPIRIGYDPPQQTCPNFPVLINLTEAIPETFVHQFQRIAEIVMDTPTARQAGRQRYCFYRDHGFELKTHDISR